MEVVPNIFMVKIPLPFKPGHVNCYLLKGGNGWSIIDTGINFHSCTSVWESTFKNLGLNYGDIEGIYITHLHPCHYGAAGWLQGMTGAPVFMTRAGISGVDQIWKKGRSNTAVIGELFKENGVPPGIITEVVENLAGICNIIQPHPSLYPVQEGGVMKIAGRLFEVIKTPGHSDCHIVFFSREDGILISGDHLVSEDFSIISLWPTSNPNPLALYITSLEETGCLPVSMVLPGHGQAFTNYQGAVGYLLDYVREKLDRIEDLAGAGATAYQICTGLSECQMLSGEKRFNLTETLAYLAYLESMSRVTSRLDGGIVTYRKVQA